MASGTTSLPVRRSFGQTTRPGAWWLQPVAVFLGLSAFIVYSTWAAFQGEHYSFASYLSPFYSPELFGATHHAWFGPQPSWWFGWLPWSPAFLILWAPGGFRLTCYYYRGAYYKAFWADPPSCAVGEPRKTYWGERSFPLIMQNAHRYFVYRTEQGVGLCNITKCCTKVCPEGITITDNAIIPLKERVADGAYDPVGKLIQLVAGRSKD